MPSHLFCVLSKIALSGLFAVCLMTGSPKAQQFNNPLSPPDTESPRATLNAFIKALNRAYLVAETANPKASRIGLQRAVRCLDLSEIPKALARSRGLEIALMLKEVLDRIPLPLEEEIPGIAEVETSRGGAEDVGSNQSVAPITSWTIPKADIVIQLVTDGDRKGEFLFSPETVERVSRFYERVKDLPYKQSATPNIFQAYYSTPGRKLDLRWNESLPVWITYELFGQTVWQWGATVIVLSCTLLLIMFLLHFGRRLDGRRFGALREAVANRSRLGTLTALAISFYLVQLAQWLIDEPINSTGNVQEILSYGLAIADYFLVCWFISLAIMQVGELIIHLRKYSLMSANSQFVRLTCIFVAGFAVVAILIDAGHSFGLPAYSIVTGFGVGGLAVSLSAHELLTDLLGSIVLMWERPCKIGDYVTIGPDSGTVEAIGFRSTQLRSKADTVHSLPNSKLVAAPIQNWGKRKFRLTNVPIRISQETPTERIEAFLEGIKRIIQANENTRKDYFNVVLQGFGQGSLEILVYFYLDVPDWGQELVERQRVFLEIIRLSEQLGIEFAPTQTIQAEAFMVKSDQSSQAAKDGTRLRKVTEEFAEGSADRQRDTSEFMPPAEETS